MMSTFVYILKDAPFVHSLFPDAMLLERVLSVGEAQPGEVWRSFTHRRKDMVLQYEVRVRCQENYYRGDCTHFCRPRFDFVGHFVCDKMGNKTCVDGWTGPDCKQGVDRTLNCLLNFIIFPFFLHLNPVH